MTEGEDICQSKRPVVGHHTEGEYDITAKRERQEPHIHILEH